MRDLESVRRYEREYYHRVTKSDPAAMEKRRARSKRWYYRTRVLKLPPYGLKAVSLHLPQLGEDLAYLAGIVDGEGNIHGLIKRPTQKYPMWHVRVANTSLPLMDWLAPIGGKVALAGLAGKNKRTKDIYVWRVTGQLNVLALLEAIRPYLLIKRLVAEQVIASIKEHIANPSVNKGRLNPKRDALGRYAEILL